MHAPPHELFIVLDQFQPRYGELSRALEPLTSAADEGPLVIGSQAYYRSDTDVALLAVRFDRRSFSPHKLAWVVSVLERSKLLVLNPDKLREDDRKNFYGSYLPQYRVRVEEGAGPRDTLDELARLLGLAAAPTRRTGEPTPANAELDVLLAPHNRYALPRSALSNRAQATRRLGSGSGETDSRAMMFDPEREAVAEPEAEPESQTRRLPSSPPPAARAAVRGQPTPPPSREPTRPPRGFDTAGRYQLGRAGKKDSVPTGIARHPQAARRHLTPPPSPAALQARGKARPADRAPTLPATPQAMPHRPAVRGTSAPPVDVGPVEGGYGPALTVRFLRGDEWVPARLRGINPRGARLATSALPRVGDVLQLVVGLRGEGTLLSGRVSQVIGAREADDGSTGFALEFGELAATARSQLVALLTRARDAGVSLRPPPPRAAARFPVHWPLRLLTPRGELASEALDVSRGGLFLATDGPLSGSELGFRVALDRLGPDVVGRATIAREVNDEMASARGIPRGYGVRFYDLGPDVQQRWDQFLDRVRMRSERRLLIAARPQRAEALARGLAGAGYVVTTSSDAQGLLEQADQARAPDAALIDVGLAELDPASHGLRRMFNLRDVPCVTIGEELPERARQVVDHLLHIS